MNCKHKIGLLVLRNCNQPTRVQCTICNRPVCEAHFKTVKGDNVCLSCIINRKLEAHAPEIIDERVSLRKKIYRESGFEGFLIPYTEEDYTIFTGDENMIIVEDIHASDFQDS